MGLWTIGVFARACRLSPKALRLYDELGLLRPARVDPDSGYRFYDPAQLERARLVAWLRRLGMPLARIQVVCALEPAAAAEEVWAYWTQVQADTARRAELAASLVEHLSGRGAVMSDAVKTLEVRSAARCAIGRVRERNEDAVYAGGGLLAVADGYGREGGGDRVSAAAIEALRPLEEGAGAALAGDPLRALREAVGEANAAVRALAGSGEVPEGAGTTLTAMLVAGSRLALAHIGDSRAYLVRGGEMVQLTKDHTFVQPLVDEGRLSLREAAAHPQATLLLHSLDGGEIEVDLQLRAIRPGDRYLVCSDGLHRVVPAETLRETVRAIAGPERLADELIELADRHGGPDNIACAIADIAGIADTAGPAEG